MTSFLLFISRGVNILLLTPSPSEGEGWGEGECFSVIVRREVSLPQRKQGKQSQLATCNPKPVTKNYFYER